VPRSWSKGKSRAEYQPPRNKGNGNLHGRWSAMGDGELTCSNLAFSGQRGHGSHAPALGEDGGRQAHR
jgi:hypothetical protein